MPGAGTTNDEKQESGDRIQKPEEEREIKNLCAHIKPVTGRQRTNQCPALDMGGGDKYISREFAQFERAIPDGKIWKITS